MDVTEDGDESDGHAGPDGAAERDNADTQRRDGPERARHVATPFGGASERAAGRDDDGAVLLPALLARYRQVSLFNSPYAAHERGRAVDLYPDPGEAPSPVAGEVTAVRSADAPPKPYAADRDHLLVVDTTGHETETANGGLVVPEGAQVRVMHVDPAVAEGDRVRVGDDLGETVRSGYFGPWVDDHLHVGVRPPEANPLRATGSLPVELGPDVDIAALDWNGRGTVVETGDCYVALDRPAHPAPGDHLAGIAARVGGDGADPVRAVIDGGLVHYDGGGVLPARDGGGGDATARTLVGDPVRVAGTRVGTVAADGRSVEWRDLAVTLDGSEVTGLSLYAGHDRAGAKVVGPDLSPSVGDEVRVRLVPSG